MEHIIHEDMIEYGNVGFKQGIIYCNDYIHPLKVVVIIMDFIHPKDSTIKFFNDLKEAEKFYEKELSISIDIKEEWTAGLRAKRNKLNREIATLKKAQLKQ